MSFMKIWIFQFGNEAIAAPSSKKVLMVSLRNNA